MYMYTHATPPPPPSQISQTRKKNTLMEGGGSSIHPLRAPGPQPPPPPPSSSPAADDADADAASPHAAPPAAPAPPSPLAPTTSDDLAVSLSRVSARSDQGGRDALRFLRVYLKNAIQFPNHPSYSVVNPNNPVFHSKVGRVDGAIDFLLACGFRDDGGHLVMAGSSDPEQMSHSLNTLIDALARLEAVINDVVPGNLHLFVHQIAFNDSGRAVLRPTDSVYLHLRCDNVGAANADEVVEVHRTAPRHVADATWQDKLELKGRVGVCVHMTLYRRRWMLPDASVGFAMFSFPGGQDDPVKAWVPLTSGASNRGTSLGSVKIEVDSESLKMWRAERDYRETSRRSHRENKATLMAEGRMPEAPDLARAGVAEDGYRAPQHEHRANHDADAAMPAAYLHSGNSPTGSGSGVPPATAAAEGKTAAAAEAEAAAAGALAPSANEAKDEGEKAAAVHEPDDKDATEKSPPPPAQQQAVEVEAAAAATKEEGGGGGVRKEEAGGEGEAAGGGAEEQEAEKEEVKEAVAAVSPPPPPVVQSGGQGVVKHRDPLDNTSASGAVV